MLVVRVVGRATTVKPTGAVERTRRRAVALDPLMAEENSTSCSPIDGQRASVADIRDWRIGIPGERRSDAQEGPLKAAVRPKFVFVFWAQNMKSIVGIRVHADIRIHGQMRIAH